MPITIRMNNITPTPTPTRLPTTERQSYNMDSSWNGLTQDSKSISVQNMEAPHLAHELSLAHSNDSVTACGAGHAHSLSDCIKHCSPHSDDSIFAAGSSHGIQSRGVKMWQCCNCGEAGQTVYIQSCTCHHTRCTRCTVYASHK